MACPRVSWFDGSKNRVVAAPVFAGVGSPVMALSLLSSVNKTLLMYPRPTQTHPCLTLVAPLSAHPCLPTTINRGPPREKGEQARKMVDRLPRIFFLLVYPEILKFSPRLFFSENFPDVISRQIPSEFLKLENFQHFQASSSLKIEISASLQDR